MSDPSLFDPANYRSVQKALREAHTLPARCYTDPNFFKREQERIFDRCWHFVGREDELSAVGQYLAYESLQGSVIVIRTDSGELKAFRNACRHRGTRLLSGAGSVKRIVCPYHSWVYETDGRLSRASGMDEVTDFDLKDCRLAEVPIASWGGFVFIRYTPDGLSLASTLGDLPDVFRDYASSDFRCVRRREFVVRSNWKFLIENALEAYHTGTVHRASLGRQQSEMLDTQGDWLGLRVFVEGKNSVSVLSDKAGVFPVHPDLQGDQRTSTYFTNVMPCTQFVFAPDAIWWLSFKPLAVDQTQLILGSCFHRDVIAREDFTQLSQAYFERWDTATPEDNAICEAQQLGSISDPTHQGRFGPEEGLVHKLANWVLDQVL